MKIFINPGHGGEDSGAVGYGLREADVAFIIGRLVDKYLRNAGYDVKLFQFDGLQEICDAANDWNADLFVSIHCNSFDGNARGAETFCYFDAPDARKLAYAIQGQLIRSLPLIDRGVKENDFVVLRDTAMTAVLVETAFIDNPDDAELLRYRKDDFARAIARGITDFI